MIGCHIVFQVSPESSGGMARMGAALAILWPASDLCRNKLAAIDILHFGGTAQLCFQRLKKTGWQRYFRSCDLHDVVTNFPADDIKTVAVKNQWQNVYTMQMTSH